MTFIFGPDSFRVYLKFWWGYPYHDQMREGKLIARTPILVEAGVEESKCSRIYYFKTICFSFSVARFDKEYVPAWMKDPMLAAGRHLKYKATNVIEFRRRNV